MFKFNHILCMFIVFFQCVFHVKSIPCRGTVSYKLQFQAEWRNSSSLPRPDGAHFSGLIGCSHNKCYRMWRPGSRASLGVKNVAEEGDDTELYKVIQKHLETWKTVLERLQTKNNTIGPEAHIALPETNDNDKHKTGFRVDSSHPLVSVIARIAPSPDWFIGVHDVSLCNESGHWIQEKIITVFPYDAGTAQKSADNDSVVVPTSPHKNIDRAQEDISHFVRGIGYMRFTLLKIFDSGSPVLAIDEDNCPNMASLRGVSLLTWPAFIATIILIKS